MNLYYVERKDNWSYDDYDAYVCVASTEDQARTIGPSEYYVWKDNKWCFSYADGTFREQMHDGWVEDISKLEVMKLGMSNETEPRLVLASFNAG